MLGEQPFEYHDLVVVNGTMRLCESPLEIAADALADFSGEVPPSGEAVLPCECELSIAQRHGSLTRDSFGLLTKGFERRTWRERVGSGHCALLSSIACAPLKPG